MFLFLYLVFTSQILAIYSDSAQQKEYFDQLQEPEKQEFFERIVRRIADEVELKNVPLEETKNISDTELEKYRDYVKKIINEEKEKFEKQGRRSLNQSHVDLTLRANRRRKRDGGSELNNMEAATTEASVTIPVQTVYDSNKSLNPVKDSVGKDDIQVKGLRPKLRRSTNTNFDQSNVTAEEVVLSGKPKDNDEVSSLVTEGSETNKLRVNSELENASTEPLITTTEAEKNTIRSDGTQSEIPDKMIADKELADQKTPEKDLSTQNTNQDLKTSHEDNMKGSDKKLLEPKVTESVDIKDKTEEKLFLNTNTHKTSEFNLTEQKILSKDIENKPLETETKRTDYLDKIPIKKVDSNVTKLSIVKIPADTKRTDYLDKIPIAKVDSNITILSTVKIPADTLKQKKIVENVNKQNDSYSFTSVKNDKQKRVLNKTSELPVLTNQSNTKLNDKNKSKVSKEVSNEIETLQIAQDVVKALRIGIDRDARNNRNKNVGAKTKLNNVNVYGLYDNTEDNSNERHGNNKEQPYYVPIYNYYANNAYYNAYNKYGPNQEELKSLKRNVNFVPSHSGDISDMSIENNNKALYKTPHSEHMKDKRNNNVKILSNVYPILPEVVNQPLKTPEYDYDYIFGNNERESALRTPTGLKDTEVYLKNRIKNIREAIYTYKEISKDNVNGIIIKEGKDKNNKGWLNDNVKYFHEHRVAKSPQKLERIENIDYDYIGERDDSKKLVDNIELYDILNSKIDLPFRAKSSDTHIKKEKGSKLKHNKIQEVYPLLKKLVKIVEFEEDEEVEACIRVMGDLIQTNNEGLEQYDWLESTVNLQSAIEKLSELTAAALNDETLHPSDLELLKYTAYLHSFSEETKEDPPDVRSTLPKSNKKKKKRKMTTKGLGERVWLYRIPDPDLGYVFDYQGLQKFLDNLADNLYDLHNAIKHISMVTTLKNQHWFRNLKDLYLRKPKRKELLELILHLGSTRLFNMIEDSSKKGIEDNFLKYIHENQMEVYRIKEAFVFVLKVLDAATDNKLIESY